jgi:hypothetical protein
MTFYYISIISIAMLAVIYLVGTVILFWIGQAWRKHYGADQGRTNATH